MKETDLFAGVRCPKCGIGSYIVKNSRASGAGVRVRHLLCTNGDRFKTVERVGTDDLRVAETQAKIAALTPDRRRIIESLLRELQP